MIWWQIFLTLVSWVIVWWIGYIKGESCGWEQRARIRPSYVCFDCDAPVEANDEAMVCTGCGGRNRLL